VCRGPEAAERARRNGADDVVVLPAGPDVEALATAVTDALGGTADVVVDPVFGWVAEAATRAMTPFGRLVNLGGSAADAATLSSATIRSKSLAVLGHTNNNLTPDQRQEALTSVVALADGGPVVEHLARPLTEVADAWREVASAGTGVRQVLMPEALPPDGGPGQER
jgi:NADPH:quinone reductase-like Zn-dependent oxidoreductase